MTEDQMTERNLKIRDAFLRGGTFQELAAQFKLSPSTIGYVLLTKFGLRAEHGGRRQAQLDAAKTARYIEDRSRAERYDAWAMEQYGIGYAELQAHRKSGLVRAFQVARNRASKVGAAADMTFTQWLAARHANAGNQPKA